jgi:hypothetical protein
MLSGGLVNGASDLLLSGTRLAPNQDRGVGIGNLAYKLEELVHSRTLAQHILEGMTAL